jgi:hypothetical protein
MSKQSKNKLNLKLPPQALETAPDVKTVITADPSGIVLPVDVVAAVNTVKVPNVVLKENQTAPQTIKTLKTILTESPKPPSTVTATATPSSAVPPEQNLLRLSK